MIYSLTFLPSAQKEWRKLPPEIQSQFKDKLKKRLENPKVPASRLKGFSNSYKIKLKSSGYRLVYEVVDAELLVYVLSTGKREGNGVYNKAKARVKSI